MQSRFGLTRARVVVLAAASVVLAMAASRLNPASKTDAHVETAGLEKKLDEILANQQAMSQQLDAILEELKVIKVRATR